MNRTISKGRFLQMVYYGWYIIGKAREKENSIKVFYIFQMYKIFA